MPGRFKNMTNEQRRPSTSIAQDGPTRRLGVTLQRALEQARARWAVKFGTASQAELGRHCTGGLLALPSPDARSAERLCLEVEHAHLARYGHGALCAERADERERDLATASDAAFVAYERKWAQKLVKLQRAHPVRWRVQGLSDEEVRDALSLRLLELVRARPESESEYCRPAKEWGLCVAEQHLRVVRSRFRLGAIVMDFNQTPLLSRGPSQEECCLEQEADACRALAEQSARSQLSQPQRRWLAAMKLAANGGEFFQQSDQLNLSAVSRVLGKNRSSAQRAYRELQVRFQRELERSLEGRPEREL